MIRARPINSSIVGDRGAMIQVVTAIVQTDPRMRCVLLFGSRVAGPVTPWSDIDLAYHAVPPLDLHEEADLLYRLGDALGTHEVDLVALRAMPLRVRSQVLETGRCLYARRDEDLADLLERTRLEYFDFRHLEQEYEADFLRNLREGKGRLP